MAILSSLSYVKNIHGPAGIDSFYILSSADYIHIYQAINQNPEISQTVNSYNKANIMPCFKTD
jgi:hypothetical protein